MSFAILCRRFALLFALSIICLALARPGEVQADDLKLEARLIWGTNDKASPDPKHKSIDTPLTRELAAKFAWKHYFEVNRKDVALPPGAVKKVELSEKCSLEMKNLGDNRLEVKLFGSGKFVSKTVESIPKGKWLALAGDSENKTAWFAVLKTSDSP